MGDILTGDAIGAGNLTSDISQGAISLLLNALGPLMPYIKAISIAALIYIIFLSVKLFFGIRQVIRTRTMADKVTEINKKVDMILDRMEDERPAAKEKKEKIKEVKEAKKEEKKKK